MGVTEFLRDRHAGISLVGCESYNYPKYARYSHERSRTIADGLILEHPHPKVQERIAAASMPVHLVHDAEICAAMRALHSTQGLVVEPSSAITTAFVAAHPHELEPPICVILTGENITRDDFHRLIAGDDRAK
jgi:threonine dehydratase